MQDTFKRAALVILVLVAALVLILTDFGNTDRVVRYDCRDAHWHPDVPVEVKKACQKMMYEEWKRLQEEERKKRMV
jgi:hypothetical protein